MKLSELLDELRLNILNDRSDRTSGTSDYLWTDATLVRYINEAQNRFARRAMVIRDSSTPEVVEVTLEEGVSEYALHPAILAVVSAKIHDADYDLMRAGHSIFNNYAPPNRDNWDLSQLPVSTPGKPIAYSTDEQVVEADDSTVSAISLRIYPLPDAAHDGEVIKLRVIRKPLDQLTTGNLSAIPEIPEDHHIEMLDWAAYLALRIVDHDSGNPKRAADFAQSFEAHVQQARTMVLRKLFAPKPWGFGRSGWAWGT